jgi:DNA-binding protein YbaB
MTEMTDSYTAATPDGAVFVRVATAGHIVGVQIEPSVMRRAGHEIAARIVACADDAYLQGQTMIRDVMAAGGAPPECYAWMPDRADLVAARTRLETL